MPNATELKFGDPHNRVAQTRYWTVLLRPRQPTLGALVLVCREEVKAFSELSGEAFADLQHVVQGVEAALREVVAYERINYLMLMMVDPDVHFHVIPRYQSPRQFGGTSFPDTGWPGPPALEPAVVPAAELAEALRLRLQQAWPSRGPAA
ncbi:MAG TPA: HIT family protein [Steroidobacteraceae bacterium]|nr:HIT family protein [Steroidobacteraceae bacterium]